MTYELAKKLKDAKFPLKCTEDGTEHFVCNIAIDLKQKPQSIICPLLGELIEACGDSFHKLERSRPNIKPVSWLAWPTSAIAQNIRWGSTPEEAVANLWLALNQE